MAQALNADSAVLPQPRPIATRFDNAKAHQKNLAMLVYIYSSLIRCIKLGSYLTRPCAVIQ